MGHCLHGRHPDLLKNQRETGRNDQESTPTTPRKRPLPQTQQMRIEYLGLIIEEGKMMIDPGKLKGIRDWPTPKTVKQVRSWLGFGNFYRRFIKGFSHLAQPLNQLLSLSYGTTTHKNHSMK